MRVITPENHTSGSRPGFEPASPVMRERSGRRFGDRSLYWMFWIARSAAHFTRGIFVMDQNDVPLAAGWE